MSKVNCRHIVKCDIARFLSVALLVVMMTTVHANEHKYVPPNGFVPDAATAVAIAEAVLIPIYGRAQIEREAPFSANLKDGRWTVVGHLKPNEAGGVAKVVIDKATGEIVSVTHGR